MAWIEPGDTPPYIAKVIMLGYGNNIILDRGKIVLGPCDWYEWKEYEENRKKISDQNRRIE